MRFPLIERADRVINVCEMKFSPRRLAIDKNYADRLKMKIGTFEQVAKTRMAIQLTIMASAGMLSNKYSGIVQSEVALNDIFCP